MIAIRSNITGAYRGEGCSFEREYTKDSIDEWEEVTAVPTAALKHLRDVFLGVGLPFTQFAALQQVVSCLPTDKSSALVCLAELIEEGERDDLRTRGNRHCRASRPGVLGLRAWYSRVL